MILPPAGRNLDTSVPRALPWAELLLAFLSPLCFESEQARAQAVLPFRSGGYAIRLH